MIEKLTATVDGIEVVLFPTPVPVEPVVEVKEVKETIVKITTFTENGTTSSYVPEVVETASTTDTPVA